MEEIKFSQNEDEGKSGNKISYGQVKGGEKLYSVEDNTHLNPDEWLEIFTEDNGLI